VLHRRRGLYRAGQWPGYWFLQNCTNGNRVCRKSLQYPLFTIFLNIHYTNVVKVISLKMKNKYLSFITDEHLISCISNLHKSYLKAKNNITKENFYNNKVDTIKLIFDAKFNDINEDRLIEAEILRQIDKSINNSIGTFHEQVLGGIEGYKIGTLSGFDIKADDDTLFADIKNKHNTMNSSAAESLFQKLKKYGKKI